MIINLHIDRLVVDDPGCGAGSRRQLAHAVREQLARLLAPGELRPQLRTSAEHRRLTGGTFTLGSADGAATMGQGIARAVYEGIGETAKGAGRPRNAGRRS
ncbi:MAG: hypothetical protein RQ826_11030 [Xanthomonadales bacterium]|nr:hypothetical protein [Xanthomonadales bacterium]